MHFRRLACVFLGIWFAGSAFSVLLIVQTRHIGERMLSRAAAMAGTPAAGQSQIRPMLEFHAAEIARQYVENAEYVGILAALMVLLVLLFGTHEGKLPILTSLLMLAAASVQRAFLTPEIVAYERALSLTADVGGSAGGAGLHALHGGWLAVEAAKVAAGILLLKILLRRRARLDSLSQSDAAGRSAYTGAGR